MLIVMDRDAPPEQIRGVIEKIEAMGYRGHPIPGAQRTAIGITGNSGPLDPAAFETLPGVRAAIRVTRPYKLVGREMRPEGTLVRVGGVTFGGQAFPVIAGPCAVEGEEMMIGTAQALRASGASLLRGGAFKPRTSPYAFQGLGSEGLRILDQARAQSGLPVVTEALDVETFPLVEETADMVQIGARNMQNFALLRRAGRSAKPVLLKRGISATLEEWLMAAEYIVAEGNQQVVLCERGVRTFADHSRNTLDLSVIPAVKALSHLPIVVDPSHGTGRRDRVGPLARAALAVGAHGLMVEVHPDPDLARSDGPQSLSTEQFAALMTELRAMAPVLGRQMVLLRA
ncbi:MAG: 3-deoxy-7-phosphoheptulonate synthase [Acidobacteriota bacterium]